MQKDEAKSQATMLLVKTATQMERAAVTANFDKPEHTPLTEQEAVAVMSASCTAMAVMCKGGSELLKQQAATHHSNEPANFPSIFDA